MNYTTDVTSAAYTISRKEEPNPNIAQGKGLSIPLSRAYLLDAARECCSEAEKLRDSWERRANDIWVKCLNKNESLCPSCYNEIAAIHRCIQDISELFGFGE